MYRPVLHDATCIPPKLYHVCVFTIDIQILAVKLGKHLITYTKYSALIASAKIRSETKMFQTSSISHSFLYFRAVILALMTKSSALLPGIQDFTMSFDSSLNSILMLTNPASTRYFCSSTGEGAPVTQQAAA